MLAWITASKVGLVPPKISGWPESGVVATPSEAMKDHNMTLGGRRE